MKYLVKGYFGAKNLGDELLLNSLLNNFFDENDLIYIISKGDVKHINNIVHEKRLNVRIINLTSLIGFIKSIYFLMFTDVFIFGPGGVFTTDKPKIFILRSIHLCIARIFCKKIAILGVGFNEVNNSISKFIFRWITKQVIIMSVRDKASYVNAEKFLSKDKLIQSLDFAFHFPLQNYIKKSSVNVDKYKYQVAVCLAQPWSDKELRNGYDSRYKSLIDGIQNSLISCFPEDYKFIFIPFHGQQDINFAKLVSDHEELKSRTTLVSSEDSLENRIKIVSTVDFVFSMRFHSAVLSLLLNKKFVAISYDHKTTSLLNKFNKNNYVSLGIRKSEFFKCEFDCDFVQLNKLIVQQLNDNNAEKCLLRLNSSDIDSFNKLTSKFKEIK